MKPILVVGGATSSGKSAIAIRLAKDINAEIISLDAVQIFKGFVVGSGALKPEDQGGIPHHLIGVLSPTNEIDAAQVRNICIETIKEIQSRGKRVIIAAGSTMYLTLLIHGIANLPSGSKEIREKYRNLTAEELWAELYSMDPEAASTFSKSDRQRIERAIEVKKITGKSIKDSQKEHRFPESSMPFLILSLWRNRQVLYQRIEERCQQMFTQGLLEETKKIISEYGENVHALSSIGYKEFARFIKGEITLEEAQSDMIQATRNYAKRQMTFWKNEPQKRGWKVLPESNDLNSILIGDEVLIKKGPKPRGVLAWKLSYDELRREVEASNHESGVTLWNLSAEALIN